MKYRRASLCALALAASLAACEGGAGLSGGLDAAKAALRPASDKAGEQAVVAYFATMDKVPASAVYSFNPVANGVSAFSAPGWFMCGNVSLPDASGHLGRVRPFIAHFDPQNPERVAEGAIERGNFELVTSWCRSVYGTSYLPLAGG